MPTPAPPQVADAYMTLLERAILGLRFRLRYGEEIAADELHDMLDALHNVPTMLRDYGGWFVEENIDADLARYDARWLGRPGSERRDSLVGLLEQSKRGDFART